MSKKLVKIIPTTIMKSHKIRECEIERDREREGEGGRGKERGKERGRKREWEIFLYSTILRLLIP